MKFAIYRETEIAVRYFNGIGYVVRHDMFPRTEFADSGPVTRQGHTMIVGARQGLTDTAGFKFRSYHRPDTAPAYVPESYYCINEYCAGDHPSRNQECDRSYADDAWNGGPVNYTVSYTER